VTAITRQTAEMACFHLQYKVLENPMPIYEYRCAACGAHQEHLQKMSDAALTICPQCGAEAYSKQLSAAGFQLKGNGWYATDFKGGSKPPAAPPCQTGEGSCSSCPAS
jgi:putative FmdB family regulatory protein